MNAGGCIRRPRSKARPLCVYGRNRRRRECPLLAESRHSGPGRLKPPNLLSERLLSTQSRLSSSTSVRAMHRDPATLSRRQLPALASRSGISRQRRQDRGNTVRGREAAHFPQKRRGHPAEPWLSRRLQGGDLQPIGIGRILAS